MRRIELDKIKSHVMEEQENQRIEWEVFEESRIKKLRDEWEHSRETKHRLAYMRSDAEAFQVSCQLFCPFVVYNILIHNILYITYYISRLGKIVSGSIELLV